MEMETKPRRLRIVGGTREEVERELNQLLEDYTAIAWNFVAVGDRCEANVVLFHNSVMRQAALAQAQAAVGLKRPF